MEVHKPRLVANWRELLKEWGIIVLGVLTALLAEQAVQSLEWRHKVDSAIADMSQELGNSDGPEAYTRLAIYDCVATRLTAIRRAVEAGDRARSIELIDTLWLPNHTYDSLAREDAIASDVAPHIPTKRMYEFRVAYSLMPQMDRLADRELTDLAHLRALPASGGSLQQSEKLAEIDAIEALQLDNNAMARGADFILRHMRGARVGIVTAALRFHLDEARQHYAGCITANPPQPLRINPTAWSRSNR